MSGERPEIQQYTRDEAKILQQLEHENIVSYHDSFEGELINVLLLLLWELF